VSIFCIGVNHKTAPVEIRERLAFVEEKIPDDLHRICQIDTVVEAVVLSTCNRVEVYGASDSPPLALNDLNDFLIHHFKIESEQVEFYKFQSEAAAHHLFEVASGLDSMVLGETEIFGQVKKAYAAALNSGATSRRMNKLFQQSFSIGKLVRSNTRIQQGATSVGAAAVDLAEKIFGQLQGCQVMLVGAGDMSRSTAQSLLSRGASEMIVTNRSYHKALELAEDLGGRAVHFDDWEEALHEADIIISSTSAPGIVIDAAMIREAMRKRRGHSLFLIDIAVPRDIADQVGDVDNAYLYNIDQLQILADEGLSCRERQIAICRKVIHDHIEKRGIQALAPPREQPRPKDPPEESSTSSGDDALGPFVPSPGNANQDP